MITRRGSHWTQSASSVAGSHGEDEARPVGVKEAKAKEKKVCDQASDFGRRC